MIDPTAVFDANTRELAANYRRGILAALPADICPTAEFWREIVAVIEGYFTMVERRQRRPAKRELARWRKIETLANELGKELREVRRRSRWDTIDPLWSNRALTALWPVKDLAEAHVAGYQTLNKISRGRNDPHRQFLYGAILDLWRSLVGQDLRYSRSDKGVPRGPLIRFFAACVGPILGDDAPTAYGIRNIIDREKARAAYTPLSSRK